VRAFEVTEVDGKLNCEVRDVELVQLESTDVLVKVDYSGVNFKDALVASAPSRVRRLDKVIGGVDAAGTVVVSSNPQLRIGTRVAVHGGDLGVGRDGGFAEFVSAPSHFLSPLPSSITTRDAMIIGTAGFTAMASILALEAHGLDVDTRVLVTGATGGVGSVAVTLLAARGYQPVASTGSANEAAWLHERGAVEVIGRDEISDKPERVLGTARWAAAIDCVGGDTLQQILRSLRYGGSVAASGLVASADLVTTVYPFITRAVNLLGIDAVDAPTSTRERVWTALGETADNVDFAPLVDREITLEQLPAAFDSIRNSSTRGRILVNPTPG
jgi:acrylyl-CoA reductase (NADPH)